MLNEDSIGKDEDLILKLNPFIAKPRKISVKLKDEFTSLSKFLINNVPKDNTEKFVGEVGGILNDMSGYTFHSVSGMIDRFHSLVKDNQVIW